MLPLFHLTQKPGQIIFELADEIIRHVQQEERLSGSGSDGIDEYFMSGDLTLIYMVEVRGLKQILLQPCKIIYQTSIQEL